MCQVMILMYVTVVVERYKIVREIHDIPILKLSLSFNGPLRSQNNKTIRKNHIPHRYFQDHEIQLCNFENELLLLEYSVTVEVNASSGAILKQPAHE